MIDELEKILGDFMVENTGEERVIMSIPAVDKARQRIKELFFELISKAHQDTTRANTMPLISSYRAIDDMKRSANQRVEEL